MNYLASFITSFTGVLSFCGLIFMSALVVWFNFKKEINPINQQLKKANSFINKLPSKEYFANNLELFSADIRHIPLLKPAWNEFSGTLMTNYAIENPVISSTQSAANFFSRQAILGHQLNIRFYSAFSNLLTGFGILGTFIGLVCGIWLASKGLSSSNAEQAKQALEQLLNGASLAFLTSITGLICSLLFSWREKKVIHQLEQARYQWINSLDNNLQRVTSESLSLQALELSQQQTSLLKQFSADIAIQIAEHIDHKLSQSLGLDLTKLGNKIDQSNEQLISALTPLLTQIADSTAKMHENQQKDNLQMIEQMIASFSKSLLAAAGQEMQALGQTLQGLNQQLSTQVNDISQQYNAIQATTLTQIDSMNHQQALMQQTAKQQADEMQLIFKNGMKQFKLEMTDSLDIVNNRLGKLVDDSSDLLDSSSKQIQSLFEKVSNSLDDSLEQWNDTAQNSSLFLKKTQGVMSQLENLSESFINSQDKFNRMMAPFENVTEQISEVSGDIVNVSKALNKNIERFNDNQLEMKQIWKKHEKRFKGVDDSLANTFQEIEAGLTRYTVIMKDFVNELDSHSSSISSDLAGANIELREAIEDLSDIMSAQTNKP